MTVNLVTVGSKYKGEMMEARKLAERSFFDSLGRNGIDENENDQKKAITGSQSGGLYGNKKWYSINRRSRRVVTNFLRDECNSRVVLDYCCGNGSFALAIAEFGASKVIGIDISEKSITNAKMAANERGVTQKAEFQVMDAENMSFDDNSFDIICCIGVLHHLDIEKAYSELARVLKPDGKILANEPLAYNPLIHLYRKMTPYMRTPWEVEHILKKRDIDKANAFFREVEILGYFHLLSIAAVPLRKSKYFNMVLSLFEAIDKRLLRLPIVRWLAWQIIFVMSLP